jgi:hypothetical protein
VEHNKNNVTSFRAVVVAISPGAAMMKLAAIGCAAERVLGIAGFMLAPDRIVN